MQYEIHFFFFFFFLKISKFLKLKRLKLNIDKNYKICRENKVKITEIRRHTSYKFKIINLHKK